MKKHILHISGTHCPSCKILIEDILADESGLANPVVHLKSHTLEVESESPDETALAQRLTQLLQSHGYHVSTEKHVQHAASNNTIWIALPIGLVFLIAFFALQRSGLLNIGIGGMVTPFTSFIIGLIASVSSCLAIVGGLVLSLSAKVSQDNISDTKTFVLFHASRIISFAVLGGILGLIGKAIGINFTVTSILGLVAAFVMILLGLNLIGILKKNQVTLPSGIFKYFRKIEHTTWAPILVGAGTFFLPCGFTQSMQVAALGSGSFLSGLLIMLGFALGTLPVLALLSFGSASLAHSRYAPLFFKSAGVVVVGLGLFAALAGFAGLGIISPLFTL